MLKLAEQLLADMDADGLWAKSHTFGALLRCCWRPRDALRAEHWFRQAVAVYEVRPGSALADIVQKSVGMERALMVCSELGVDLRQLLAANKGKGKGKGGKGRGRGGGTGRGGRDSGHSSGGGDRGRQQGGDRGGRRGTAGGNGEKCRW
jgi:hypothetical protein